MDKDAEFQKRLLATFALEAQEHLKGITDGLLALEQQGSIQRHAEIIETVFREAHSLKGAARAVTRTDIEALCQALEGLFSALKRKEVELSPALFDLMQRARDLLARLLAEGGEQRETEPSRREMIEALSSAAKGRAYRLREAAPLEAERPAAVTEGEPVAAGASVSLSTATEETVRVPAAKLASLLLLSEEMVSAKLSVGRHVVQMRELRLRSGSWRKEWARVLPELQTVGVLLRRLAAGSAEMAGEDAGALQKIMEFLKWNEGFLKSQEGRSSLYLKSAERSNRMLGGMVDTLLGEVKKVMMFPFSSLLEAFPKMVRDLSRDCGKEVELVIRGDELEIDRRILEEMKDPFLHLVRNCIGHGIELPLEREGKQKRRQGTLTISIAPREGRAEIVVSDDGAGIDAKGIRSALVRGGTLSADQAGELSFAQLLPFVFQSGVSTTTITEMSGRGLGLAIVREKVEKLGGSITLETEPERGTSFRIVLPLTVATFRGIVVRVADRHFVIPALQVERAVRVKREEVATVQNREIIEQNGQSVALVVLGSILDLPRGEPQGEQLQAVLVTVGEQSVAFVVDEVLNEREVLMKSLGPQLSRVRNIAGATLLGSGKVVPILNVSDLIKSALRGMLPAEPLLPSLAGGAGRPQGRRILVVEDSITSRNLLRNILESAGYSVTTAVDGVDGFAQLKNGRFDLVVSDVDMPRMDGFQLTAKIRGDREYAELPVVLVTALASQEDRERGVDAGASAYVVKGSFDQSDLLETVQRLC